MKRALVAAVGFLLVSLLLARLWLNSTLLWEVLSHVPRSIWEVLAAATDPIASSDVHAQEELLEFVASWLVALVLLAILGGVGLLAGHLARGKTVTRKP